MSPEEKEQKIERLEQENLALRERIAELVVTEHRVATKECPGCKALIQGIFPESVKAPVQYGARIRAVAAYLYHQHFIPEDRLSVTVHRI